MVTSTCNAILAQSTAVRTNVLKPVRDAVWSLQADLDGITHYSTNIVSWLKPVIDLTGFHVYPTNGITEGLNWWMAHEQRSITLADGDYQWVKPKDGNGTIHYMSVPSAIDGNFKSIPKDVPVALDLAYVGSTKTQKIDISENVEYVFYSLSKPFGIRNIRTGWLFTRKPEPRLEALTHDAKYYNYFARDISEIIIKNFSIDYVYYTLREKQKQVCEEFGFTPSDSVWLATTQDDRYNRYKRGNTNRLCLAPCY